VRADDARMRSRETKNAEHGTSATRMKTQSADPERTDFVAQRAIAGKKVAVCAGFPCRAVSVSIGRASTASPSAASGRKKAALAGRP